MDVCVDPFCVKSRNFEPGMLFETENWFHANKSRQKQSSPELSLRHVGKPYKQGSTFYFPKCI